MKNKIAFKLTLYFSAALFLFSLIIGGVFITLFKEHTVKIQKSDMEKRASTIAGTLSSYLDSFAAGTFRNRGGYGAYLRFLGDIAMTDVWIVDKDLSIVTSASSENCTDSCAYLYSDLPDDAEAVVKKVFEGNTTFSEGFSKLLNTPTLTVGTPIYLGGEIYGALLLHSPVQGIDEAVKQGSYILTISIFTALLVSILLSAWLAIAFTKPLKKMKNAANLLASGDYTVKTKVSQNDEIGELASSLDILSDKLYEASQKSEQLLKLRHDFVANISHELRTPVTVIRGSLEALCDEIITEPEEIKRYHRQMLSESIFLQRLVNDLLDLSRLQNTDFKIDMQEISLCDVINDAVRSATQIAQEKNITINLALNAQSCSVSGDYGRLRQMFIIILDNAIKFSPVGSVVNLSLQEKTVSIKDCGIGIKAEDLPYIFDRFYKIQSEKNKNGTGLGLSIAKQIADRHNIKLSVSSKENIGTEFRFEFKPFEN